jgi:hypothetical protein
MTINEFNNEEVLFMYFTNKIDLDSYQHVVDTRTVIDIMDPSTKFLSNENSIYC